MMDSVHTVTVAIFLNTTHVLLLQRDPDEYPGHGDKWELIGGHIYLSEQPEIAAEREVYEETGIVGLFLHFFRIDTFGSRDANNWIYTARLKRKLPVRLSPEHQAWRWMPVEEALRMPLANKHSMILHDIVSEGGTHR